MILNAMIPKTQADHNLPYIDSLNEPQRQAVQTTEGPVLVLAGAGTGKTKALTARLAHLLSTNLAYPSQILAVTFTNRAALEMKKRVARLLGQEVEGWWLGTFHSLAARMLRRHAELVGLRSNFTILDDDDQARLIKQLLEAENIDTKKCTPRLVLGVIQRWKDRGLLPDQISAHDAGDMANGRMTQIYRDYQARLKTLNTCDFGDLLLHMVNIFRDPKYADVLADYQNRFKYILVDEYQDTNTVQYQWLRLLAQKNKNICCVGDDDQSIYGWRGADIGNILKFEQDFPGAAIIRLEQNYRSTQHILSAANSIIAHNKGRLGKTLWSADATGDKVFIQGVWDGQKEALAIAEKIEDFQRKKTPLSQMAILVRASHQTREFEERFIKESIPYRVIGGLRFYERQEIRDAIAYLRIVVQPDDDLALARIINTPKRGIGDATLQTVHTVARAKNQSLYATICQLLDTEEFKPKVRDTLRRLVSDFDRWRAQLRELSHVELTQIMLDESGYTGMWMADKSPEAAGRLDNLKEFVGALGEFENLDSFLEHVSLVMERQEKEGDDMVSVMTLHSAKGLEFDVVFLPGWEEGVFPNQRTMDETGMTGLEEERRLAYVGLTRARKKAIITFAANRLIYGSWTSCLPSRFLDEIDKNHVEAVVETGLYNSSAPRSYHQRPRAALTHETFEPITPSLESDAGLSPNDRVFHQKFGYGTIIATDHDKLDIKFDNAGRKKVIDSFVTKV